MQDPDGNDGWKVAAVSTDPLGTTPITVTTRPLSLVVMDFGRVTFS